MEREEASGIGFPGSSVVKNPPARGGDTGSILGPGRSPMPWINEAHVPQLLSPHGPEPVLYSERSHHRKEPSHCKEEQPLLSTTATKPAQRARASTAPDK